MKIVFMGSPEFAVPTLKKLVDSSHKVVAVYTKPPIYSDRELRKRCTTVYSLAKKLDLEIHFPHKLNIPKNIEYFKSLNPDIAVVTAYGLLIPKELLTIPKYGFINVHPSNLPRWRGPAPIQRAIMAGDNKISVCIMKINEGLDTGDVIYRKDIILHDSVTGKELHDQCAVLGSQMIIDVLNQFNLNQVVFSKQSNHGITYAKKISSQEGLLNFQLTVSEINNKIRALSPKPGAYFIHKNEIIKVIKAKIILSNHSYPYGRVIDHKLSIACKDGILKPILLQRQGKKMIYNDAFLRGFSIQLGDMLTAV